MGIESVCKNGFQLPRARPMGRGGEKRVSHLKARKVISQHEARQVIEWEMVSETETGVMRWQDDTAEGGRWLFEIYRRDLKRIYPQLEEPRGWGGPPLTELREEKWERALAALLRRAARPTRMRWWLPKVPSGNTHSAGTTINLNGEKRMDR
jgi:hypothetical protein